jgi:hypothetical protein
MKQEAQMLADMSPEVRFLMHSFPMTWGWSPPSVSIARRQRQRARASLWHALVRAAWPVPMHAGNFSFGCTHAPGLESLDSNRPGPECTTELL